MNLGIVRNIIASYFEGKGIQRNVSPEDITRWLNVAQVTHFKRRTGLPEEYVPGTPIPSEVVELTKRITADLRPFYVYVGYDFSTPLFLTNGIGEIPSDMYYPLSMIYHYSLTARRPIDIVGGKKFHDRIGDAVEKPTLWDPVSTFIKDNILVEPRTISQIDFLYLKYPRAVDFKVIADAGFFEYDPEHSIELEWDDVNTIDIIFLALNSLGYNLVREEVLTYAEKAKITGK